MRIFPSEHVETLLVTSTGAGLAFGFTAAAVRLQNLGERPCRFTLALTGGVLAGGGVVLDAGEGLTLHVPTSGASLTTTGGRTLAQIGAWG